MALKRPESVLVVIYDDQHRVLVMRRNDDPSFWQSVTGSLEPGELPWVTAKREVAEETGIDTSTPDCPLVDCQQRCQYVIRPRWRHRYPPGTLLNTEHVFRLQVPHSTPITLTEHSAFEWLSKQDAIERVWSTTNKVAIASFVPGPL